MSEEKKDAIDAEVVSETEVKEEKKENGFSKFWKKTKQSVNDAVLESKIESSYRKAHTEFTIYTKDEMFSKSTYGELNGLTLTVFGKVEAVKFAVVVDEKTQNAYYITDIKESTCKSIVDAVEYERPATEITLNADVTEVKVVKAGKRYFLYQGE